jgi:hypothetical protein
LDGTGVLSEASGFGWLRTAGYLVVKPDPKVSLAAGGLYTVETGTPHFLTDKLYSKRAFHLRGDVDLGSIRATSLVKYDIDRASWYDVEYGFAFAAGSFEPYLNYRQFPRELQFGVRLRVDEFLDLLTDRNVQRRRSAE